ncbi:MAG TPA: EAL domain-containing response regulator [Candidatus Limnocylindria bacterium]|nr:EAL domain-containing response regulator [Candidatus Limnocylindria bacterium]
MTHASPAPASAARPILVVDDEPAVRALFARVLQGEGHATIEAADGVQAIERLEAGPVALLLLDSTMPRLDGPGVIRAVRARPVTRTLPIILVTAKAELEDRVEGLAAGADDYLTKPVALDELKARVAAQLRSHAAWQEAFEQEASQRRAVTAALRRVRIDGSPERVAATLVDELLSVLDLEALGLARLCPDGSAVPLAMGGAWAGRYRLAIALQRHLASPLQADARQRWLLEGGPIGDGQPAGGEVMVAQPAGASADGSGLLVMGLPLRRGSAVELVRRMPLFVEVADLVATLLRPGMEAGASRSLAHAALRQLIEEAAFTPHFQPLVALADGALVGYEALTRFDDGAPPEMHFAEAVTLELGHELELATLTAAVGAAVHLPVGAFLALNVSPGLVLQAELARLLGETDRQLVLEITEHSPIHDYAALETALARIKPPIRVAVDDAGSGYASLRHILALRPGYVKLDMGWVRDIDADPARQALVAGLVHFAAEVGCTLIGEGIESEAERQTLLRLGVTLGQGYLFGRPAVPSRVPG